MTISKSPSCNVLLGMSMIKLKIKFKVIPNTVTYAPKWNFLWLRFQLRR